MATRNLIRAGSSSMTRLLASENAILHHMNPVPNHQIFPPRHLLFPSLSRTQPQFHFPQQNDTIALNTAVPNLGFFHPSGLPYIPFFLPDGNSSSEPMLCFPKRTFQPSLIRRTRNHGFAR